MNTEEVVAMIDAITEGREYEYKNNDTSCVLLHPDEGILFSADFDAVFEVNDPRTALEIAGALVAWANRKEGNTEGKARRESFDLFYGAQDPQKKPDNV